MNSNIEKKSIRGVVGSLFKNDVIRTFAILLALIIFLVIARPGTFVTADNFWSTLSQVSVNAILVMGLFLAILTGGINISIEIGRASCRERV